MTAAERSLLVHRLRELADTHQRAADDDSYADTADTLVLSWQREHLLDAPLLREAAAAVQDTRSARLEAAACPPCGECHLQSGETCDICGARNAQVQP